MSVFAKSISALALLCSAAPTFGFEQGSYHVFDLLDTDKQERLKGCISIDRTTLQLAPKSEGSVSIKDKKSEFIIDFSSPSAKASSVGFDVKINEFDKVTIKNAPFSPVDLEIGPLDLGKEPPFGK